MPVARHGTGSPNESENRLHTKATLDRASKERPLEPTVFLAFINGFFGSLAVECILFLQAIGPRGGISAKYKTRTFWGVRLGLAFLSGWYATAYFNPQLPLYIYFHLGAATPAILMMVFRTGDVEPKNGSAVGRFANPNANT